jgi:hypothetical protein
MNLLNTVPAELRYIIVHYINIENIFDVYKSVIREILDIPEYWLSRLHFELAPFYTYIPLEDFSFFETYAEEIDDDCSIWNKYFDSIPKMQIVVDWKSIQKDLLDYNVDIYTRLYRFNKLCNSYHTSAQLFIDGMGAFGGNNGSNYGRNIKFKLMIINNVKLLCTDNEILLKYFITVDLKDIKASRKTYVAQSVNLHVGFKCYTDFNMYITKDSYRQYLSHQDAFNLLLHIACARSNLDVL